MSFDWLARSRKKHRHSEGYVAVGVRASDVGETVNVLQLGYQTGMNLQSVAVVLVDKGNIYLDIVENYVPMIVNVGPVAFDTWMEIRLDITPPPAPSNVSCSSTASSCSPTRHHSTRRRPLCETPCSA